MPHECPDHSGVIERLKSGDEKFASINYTLEQFKIDMKNIADKFAGEA